MAYSDAKFVAAPTQCNESVIIFHSCGATEIFQLSIWIVEL